jgi:small-conductance mechanosensitive channel
MFGRTLYDANETKSILEIRLALHCQIFEEIKSSFFNVADFLILSVVTLLMLLSVSFCTFCSADTGIKIIGRAPSNCALKWASNDSHALTL